MPGEAEGEKSRISTCQEGDLHVLLTKQIQPPAFEKRYWVASKGTQRPQPQPELRDPPFQNLCMTTCLAYSQRYAAGPGCPLERPPGCFNIHICPQGSSRKSDISQGRPHQVPANTCHRIVTFIKSLPIWGRRGTHTQPCSGKRHICYSLFTPHKSMICQLTF